MTAFRITLFMVSFSCWKEALESSLRHRLPAAQTVMSALNERIHSLSNLNSE